MLAYWLNLWDFAVFMVRFGLLYAWYLCYGLMKHDKSITCQRSADNVKQEQCHSAGIFFYFQFWQENTRMQPEGQRVPHSGTVGDDCCKYSILKMFKSNPKSSSHREFSTNNQTCTLIFWLVNVTPRCFVFWLCM